MSNFKFKQLTITDWKQFGNIEIDFHSHLTILTGANGSGKTTILNILATHFGWNHKQLATPSKESSTGIFTYFTRLFRKETTPDTPKIGELTYSDDHKTDLNISHNGSPEYLVDIHRSRGVNGISIPSHRPTFFYRNVDSIRTTKRSKKDASHLASQSSMRYYYHDGGQSSNYYIKETLMSWAIGGEGNKYFQSDSELINNFEGFQHVLKKILPVSIGFKELSIRNFEVVLVTDSGDFMIDASSGGMSALIDLSWQIFTYCNDNEAAFTVLIDEIENHLHPEMQRVILPNLISAFPNIQFIVSTHSPLIVSSVSNSNIYAFRHKTNQDTAQIRVYNEKLDLINKAKTATEILNEVLGVPFTMPLWAEEKLKVIVTKYTQQEITEDTFDNMRSDLKAIGLEELMPEAIKQTLRKS